MSIFFISYFKLLVRYGHYKEKNAENYNYEALRLESKKCVLGQVVRDRRDRYDGGMGSLEGENKNLKSKEIFPDAYFKDCSAICFRCRVIHAQGRWMDI